MPSLSLFSGPVMGAFLTTVRWRILEQGCPILSISGLGGAAEMEGSVPLPRWWDLAISAHLWFWRWCESNAGRDLGVTLEEIMNQLISARRSAGWWMEDFRERMLLGALGLVMSPATRNQRDDGRIAVEGGVGQLATQSTCVCECVCDAHEWIWEQEGMCC